MLRRRLRGITWLALAGCMILAACGTSAPQAVTPPAVNPPVTPVVPSDSSDADVKKLLSRVFQQSDATRNWTATAYSELVDPQGRKGFTLNRTSSKRPEVLAATVLESDDHKKVGTKIVFDGVSQVALRTTFFGFFSIRLKLAVDDKRLLDPYNRSLKDSSTHQLFEVLRRGQTKRLGLSSMGGENVEMLEVRSPASWPGISREVIGISARLGLPVYRGCYDERNRRIFCLELRDMKTNVTFSSREFTLD